MSLGPRELVSENRSTFKKGSEEDQQEQQRVLAEAIEALQEAEEFIIIAIKEVEGESPSEGYDERIEAKRLLCVSPARAGAFLSFLRECISNVAQTNPEEFLRQMANDLASHGVTTEQLEQILKLRSQESDNPPPIPGGQLH